MVRLCRVGVYVTILMMMMRTDDDDVVDDERAHVMIEGVRYVSDTGIGDSIV